MIIKVKKKTESSKLCILLQMVVVLGLITPCKVKQDFESCCIGYSMFDQSIF